MWLPIMRFFVTFKTLPHDFGERLLGFSKHFRGALGGAPGRATSKRRKENERKVNRPASVKTRYRTSISSPKFRGVVARPFCTAL